MTKSFDYGASFNCVVGYGEKSYDIGGGGEGDMTTDYVGNSIDALFAHIKAINPADQLMLFKTDHDLIDEDVQQITQGEVVAVVVSEHGTDDEHVLCVIFNKPQFPEIVE